MQVFIKKNPTRCNSISKFYYSIFIWSSTCFGWHIAHHQEPKTALAASSGFYMWKVVWMRSWWMLSGTLCLTTFTNYAWNNKMLIHCCILLDFSLWIVLWCSDPRTSS